MQMVVKTTTTPVDGEATIVTETLNFTYDASGVPMSVTYGDAAYYYATNIQGDVMAILNTSGSAVVEYTYDAWGNLHEVSGTLAETLGEVNPLTYRGYVYDRDSDYYYLQSRYYDPEVGRFINADGFVSTGQGLLGNNMFTYCLNNPIMFIDLEGDEAEALYWWITTMWWMPAVDTVLPFGDLIYTLGAIVLSYELYTVVFDTISSHGYDDSTNSEQSAVTTSHDSVSTPGAPEPPDKNKKPSLKSVSKYLLKKLGIDAHNLKKEYLGKKAEIKLYDLAYDTNTGIVYIVTKTGQIVAKTYVNVFGDIPLW